VPEGTTLRTYLSKVLNCDPMRITKKYTGNSSIGKRTFAPLCPTNENLGFIKLGQQELRDLRRVWISKLFMMEQWNNRKLNLIKGTSTPYSCACPYCPYCPCFCPFLSFSQIFRVTIPAT
jgi:hypothetical protein